MLQQLLPALRKLLVYAMLLAGVAGTVFLVQISLPKPMVQQQAQSQVQSQSQSTTILTFNVGMIGQHVPASLSYDLVSFHGYAWELDRVMTQANAYVNALPDIKQQFGATLFPVTFGFSCYVYVRVPVLHSK